MNSFSSINASTHTLTDSTHLLSFCVVSCSTVTSNLSENSNKSQHNIVQVSIHALCLENERGL